MTGTRLAGELGRIPIENAIASCLLELRNFGYPLHERILCVATYIDNLFTFARDGTTAIHMSSLLERALGVRWGLTIKPGSKHVISAAGQDTYTDPSWQPVRLFETLGHIVHFRCSCTPAVVATCRAMWGTFFKHFRSERIKCLSIDRKCKALSTHVWSKLAYRCSGWPFLQKIVDAIDHIQLKMVGILLEVSPWPDEQLNDFLRRRSKSAAAIIDDTEGGHCTTQKGSLLGARIASATPQEWPSIKHY